MENDIEVVYKIIEMSYDNKSKVIKGTVTAEKNNMNELKDRIFWCNSHNRFALAEENGKPCCDRKLAGIMLPCRVVELTNDLEVICDEDGKYNEISFTSGNSEST